MVIDTLYDQNTSSCPKTWSSYYTELNQGALEYLAAQVHIGWYFIRLSNLALPYGCKL